MIQEADNLEQPDHGADYERHLWRFLDAASPRWTKADVPDDTAARHGAFTRLVLSGQVQLRLRVRARGLPGQPEVVATVVVTGDYAKMLTDEIRSAVPEYSGRVVVAPQSPVEHRLTRAGQETQQEIREFGGGELEEGLLSASLEFAIPGAVSIRDLRYVETEPVASEADDDDAQTSAADQRKRPKAAAWPVHKTEGHVSAYLNGKKNIYRKFAADVLDEMPGAYGVFRKEFGPTRIAEAVTKKAGTKNHRACTKKDVCKTQTYKRRIQPLMRNPPERPYDWEEVLEDQYGEALPGVLDEIPFEDDDS